ncbi:hypothetical protein BZG01_08815 [Labilibaculum manganireducens]|uniref:Lipoprotein n=1 Tax=Labilibaculum manganireducens TaxID=1940525 RepID=A0A2N3IA45_9BACT|nr:hypothetical protein [Labilibaculum manganireducens]PKQ67186.1 hypothetical protein BZG01_08815 [Labilibaculum manganireducens]
MKKFSFLLIVSLAVIFFSCDKSDDVIDVLNEDQVELNNTVKTVVASEESTEDVMVSVDYETDLFSFAQESFDEVTSSTKCTAAERYRQMFQLWKRYKGEQLPNVAVQFADSTRFPMTITIDYGDSTVLNNGRVLSGTIVIVLTAAPFTDGAVREITLDLVIDGIAVDGWKRIEFTGEQGVSRKFACTSELTFTFPDETTLFRTAERTREWVSGLDTKWDVSDDRIEIRGSVTCVDSEQNEYSKTIDAENPLVRIGTCRVIVSGLVIFTQNQIEFARLDYGNGECDNTATYSYTNDAGETVTEEIEIGKHLRLRDK